MLIGQAQIVRSEWYDRNPITISRSYSALVAGPGSALGFSYIVPANRMCWISGISCSLFRNGAATTADYAVLTIAIHRSGVPKDDILRLIDYDNTIRVAKHREQNIGFFLQAGDAIRLDYYDYSTGGNYYVDGCFCGTEVDA